ncbi:uncharacterized protein BO80DRAFT_429055 [Aspergillus ibericus CBS 121593]|uniref:RNase MRP protein 1 RNA binding domain-containing protein n=1 Tax=Aspergillus ibericus CBS 121593 TaxID=1448316 RepID=A0A395GLP7_9EURO|nr:hypothetical protein BO80DRAFT_429055 [Aspergillus ibericus CBS 121593]RAK96425.1 hypothetical protein BO80DRAFT_429055 [Aspergillus ibericus CBS 121593]
MIMDVNKVSAVHSILHLIFHRNKNQHRGTKWWKWLSILKRDTLKLAKSLDRHGGPGPSADEYKHHLAIHVIPKCYLAFSTVVADGQFSTLGTVLLATLARLTRATGIDKEMMVSTQQAKTFTGPVCGIDAQKNEDVGVVLCRRENSSAPMMPSRTKDSHNSRHAHNSGGPKEYKSAVGLDGKKIRKKKRTKDAIDDLFDSLL